MARDKTRMKRKERKNIAAGVVHVNSSFNNTKILTISHGWTCNQDLTIGSKTYKI